MRTAQVLVLAIVALSAVLTLLAQPPAPAPAPAATPTSGVTQNPAFPSSHWEHLRLDGSELIKLGDGDIDKGMTLLGGRGYRLFAITSAGEGQVGWHLFKRQPWNQSVARPRFEYKRLDGGQIATLGGDNEFATGIAKVEADNWQLVAFTTLKDGRIGYYYFERPAAGQ